MFNCAPTPARSAARARESTGEASRTIEGWLCLPSGEVYGTTITCTLEQAGAVLELKLKLGTTDAETVRTVFAELGILLGDDISDDDIATLASTPIRYRIDVNGATATGITVMPTTTGIVDDSSHRQAARLEAFTSF